MNLKQLESALTIETKGKLDRILKNNIPRKKLFLRTAADIFTEDEIHLLEDFISAPGFSKFMLRRRSISAARFENTVSLLFRRIVSGTDPERTGEIAGMMGTDKYYAAERSFFRIPVDKEAFEIFESSFIKIGEQNIDVLEEYIDFCLSEEYIFFKSSYRTELELYKDIFSRLTSLLISKKDKKFLMYAVRQLLTKHIVRLISAGYFLKLTSPLLDQLFSIFYHHKDPETAFLYLKHFMNRYRSVALNNEKVLNTMIKRLGDVWDYCMVTPAENLDEFNEFMNLYGNSRDDFELFIWNIVFSLETEKASRAIKVLVSTAFNSLKGFYSNDRAIIRFLVKNIIAAISEMDIKNFASPLYGIVIKLFLGLKVNRGFIKRRADFFTWLKEQTSSSRLEMEIIRFMFFEYIYIALKLVPGGFEIEMTKFCDNRHRFFVDHLDPLPDGRTKVNETTFYSAYNEILRMLRENLWKAMYEKFNDSIYTINELRAVAESTDNEDAIITALEETSPDNLKSYAMEVLGVFRNNPEKTGEAAASDYWYRVYLADALPFCQSVLIPLVGTVQINESVDGEHGAYTDGRSIYLPSFVNYFKDPLTPLSGNRNLTYYIGLTIHEAGHILCGSYHFNFRAWLAEVERPDLLRTIMNFFEDFRIEKFLMKINPHFQTAEILKVLNEYLTFLNFDKFQSISFDFLLYIFDEAGGYNSKLKSEPAYINKIDMIMNSGLNSGRFRSLRELGDYGISRLQNIDAANPFAAHILAKEFYDIIKTWPEPDLEGVADRHSFSGQGESTSSGSDTGETSPPLTREQLDELYREYNENPEQFLRSRGFKIFPQLFPDNNKDDDSGSGDVLDRFMGELFEEEYGPAYEDAGTIDFSTRTKADDLIAEEQLRKPSKTDKKNKKAKSKKSPAKNKSGKEPDKKDKSKEKPKKFVYSIDPKTKSRTRLSEIEEFTLKNIDHEFLKSARKWEYLSGVIEQQLAFILPAIDDESDFSSVDGDLDIDLLIEVMSDKKSIQESPEVFEIRIEQKRSLEVVIGLDASGSTSWPINNGAETILDIEKVFAIIFGRALQYITDRVNVYAFNSLTSTNVYHAETVDAASSFTSNAGNRDGDFIRYVTDSLKKSDAEVKYFFLLSDGMPAAENYNGKEAMDDTLIAMRETVNSGISLIYFNFDTVKNEYFDVFQKEATYARYFSSPDEILRALPEMLQAVASSVL